MRVYKINFPSLLTDNENVYFSYLVGYLESLDDECVVQVTSRLSGINVRIAPSKPELLVGIIEEMKHFHTQLGMQLEFSKSMKTSMNINFNINF